MGCEAVDWRRGGSGRPHLPRWRTSSGGSINQSINQSIGESRLRWRTSSMAPRSTLSASSTMNPAMIAFVVAIAGTMAPAMAFAEKRDSGGMWKMYERRLEAATTKSSVGGSSCATRSRRWGAGGEWGLRGAEHTTNRASNQPSNQSTQSATLSNLRI